MVVEWSLTPISLQRGTLEQDDLVGYIDRFSSSWAGEELREVRNFHRCERLDVHTGVALFQSCEDVEVVGQAELGVKPANDVELPRWGIEQDLAPCSHNQNSPVIDVYRGSTSVLIGTHVVVHCATRCRSSRFLEE